MTNKQWEAAMKLRREAEIHDVALELFQAVKDALQLAELHDQEGAAVDNYRRLIAKVKKGGWLLDEILGGTPQ